MWCGVEAFAGALGRLQARFHWASRLANVVSCGAMLGTAMFDPISADEDHRYCEIILPLFAISAVVWHLLNLNALLVQVPAGRFTIPLGLAMLLLVAFLAGPLRIDLAAWLPLYVTTVSLLTISLSPILGRHSPRTTPTDLSAANDLESAFPTDEEEGAEEGPSQTEDLHNQALARWEQEPPARYHLLGQHDHHPPLVGQPARTATTLSLSSIAGQARSSWGSHVLRFWHDPLVLSGGQHGQSDLFRSSLDGLLDLHGMPNNGPNAAVNSGPG